MRSPPRARSTRTGAPRLGPAKARRPLHALTVDPGCGRVLPAAVPRSPDVRRGRKRSMTSPGTGSISCADGRGDAFTASMRASGHERRGGRAEPDANVVLARTRLGRSWQNSLDMW